MPTLGRLLEQCSSVRLRSPRSYQLLICRQSENTVSSVGARVYGQVVRHAASTTWFEKTRRAALELGRPLESQQDN